jgi:tRNA(adenine34) deaminase
LTAASTEDADHYWMRCALSLAEQAAEHGEVPVGAVVVLDGEVIGTGFNAPISGHDPTAHAEVRALRDAAANLGNYRLQGASLYVTIEPCTMCTGALVHARISRVVFGAREPKAGTIRSRDRLLEHAHFNWRVEVLEGVLEEECRQQLTDFFAQRRAAKKADRLTTKGDE